MVVIHNDWKPWSCSKCTFWPAKIQMTTWWKQNEFSVVWISAAKIGIPILFFIKECNFLKASLWTPQKVLQLIKINMCFEESLPFFRIFWKPEKYQSEKLCFLSPDIQSLSYHFWSTHNAINHHFMAIFFWKTLVLLQKYP